VRRTFLETGAWRGEWKLRRKDGSLVTVEATNTRLRVGNRDLYQGLFRDISENKRIEMERQQAVADLAERVKELTCLHLAARLLQDTHLETAHVLQTIANQLPLAWAYPEVAAARIEFDGLSFASPGFADTAWSQDTTFETHDARTGRIEVCYLAERPPGDEGPFLLQERAVLESIAEMLRGYFERQGAETALSRQAQELRALVEHATDSILRFDRHLRLVYVNPAGERMRGLPATDLVGKTTEEAGLAAAQLPAWEVALKQVLRTGRDVQMEVPGRLVTGEVRLFQARLSPVFGPDGTVDSVMSIARDVSDHRRAQAERERLYQELMEREARLSEMIKEILFEQAHVRRRDRAAESLVQLTQREREILRLLADGRTNLQIAQTLGLSGGTVRNHVSHLIAKLNVSDRTQAAIRALEWGLLD
jgi:PAS domain S-box-containing protein